jgi:hypothetical protein
MPPVSCSWFCAVRRQSAHVFLVKFFPTKFLRCRATRSFGLHVQALVPRSSRRYFRSRVQLSRILVFRCRTRFFVACCSLAGLRQLYLRSASNSACRFACVQSVRGNICKAVLIFCLRVSSYRWMPVSFLSSQIKRLEFF